MAVTDQREKGLQEQLDKCPFHDVTVIVEGTEFKCHRFLLSAYSDFFRALFQSGMKEDLDNKVVLRNISVAVFRLIYDSIYFGKEVLTDDNVLNVWHAVHLLQIGYLLEACEIFQCKRLSKENCVSIYFHSKFLSSKKLQVSSWDCIIKEFDHLRTGDEILLLDLEDMKRLVGDNNLTIPSEDVVIDAIMRWVMFIPNLLDGFKEGSKFDETDQQEITDNKTPILADHRQDDLNYSHNLSNNNQEHSDKVLGNFYGADYEQALCYFNSKERRENGNSKRKELLSELLAASKFFLVSGACLVSLLENKLILEDPKSLALVREGIRYNHQLNSRQSFCPSYGIHRNGCLLQNVIFSISMSDSNKIKYLFRTLDEKWFLMHTGGAYKCRVVTYGNDLYRTPAIGIDKTAYKYDSTNNTWKQVASMIVPREDYALVCLDNYIYALGGTDCTSIERFDAEAEQKVPGSGKWENFGNLVQPMTNLMATTCSNMIVIFGSDIEDSPLTIVQTFNIHSATSNIVMDNMSGSAKNMVSFKHGEDTFVLQESSALWKVSLDNSLLLNIEFHTMLWADPFTLNGAVVTNQELLVFGVDIDPQMSREWEVCNFEHFKRIKIIEREGYGFLNIVIPKKHLVTPETYRPLMCILF